MSIAVDNTATPAGRFSATSNTFSVPANRGIFVVCGSPLNVVNASIGDNQGGLAWNKRISRQIFTDCNVEIWWVYTVSPLTGVILTPNGGSQYIAPIVLSEVSETQNGPTNYGNSASGVPSVSLARDPSVNSKIGSFLLAAVASRITTAPTIPGDQSDVFGSQTLMAQSGGNYCWAQRLTALTTDDTTDATLSNTGTPAGEFVMVAVEILPAAAPSNVTALTLAVG